jgi:hypothetical protein
MWNVLKFTYSDSGSDPVDEPGKRQVHTKIHGYLHLGEAETMFDHLRVAYQYDMPLRVKGGKRIRILSVSLYTSFRDDQRQAEEEVRNGGARLIQEAHEIEIDLD